MLIYLIADSVTQYTGAWLPEVDDTDQWIQTDLQERYFFNEIWIQGQSNEPNWVTNMTLLFSDDAGNWTTYYDVNGDSVFPATTDQNSTSVFVLDPRPVARYIRINPQGWNNHIAMRYELIGCQETEQQYCKYTTTRVH